MKRKESRAVSTMAGTLAVGAAVCIGITLIGAGICAALISSEAISAGSDGYCALGILLVAVIAGAAIGAGKAKGKRLYVCLLVGVIYLLLLFAMTALFFDGQYEGVGVTALVVFSGTLAAAFLRLNGGKRSNLRKSRIKHR